MDDNKNDESKNELLRLMKRYTILLNKDIEDFSRGIENRKIKEEMDEIAKIFNNKNIHTIRE